MTFSWREPGKARSTRRYDDDDDDTKPLLTAVFDHYDVEYGDRTTGMTNCPLHEDRTPSLSFNLDKGLWRCHSCGEGGDSYRLIERKEQTDFKGAREYAERIGFAEGGGASEQYVSRYGGRRSAPSKSRPASGQGYTPAWRRAR